MPLAVGIALESGIEADVAIGHGGIDHCYAVLGSHKGLLPLGVALSVRLFTVEVASVAYGDTLGRIARCTAQHYLEGLQGCHIGGEGGIACAVDAAVLGIQLQHTGVGFLTRHLAFRHNLDDVACRAGKGIVNLKAVFLDIPPAFALEGVLCCLGDLYGAHAIHGEDEVGVPVGIVGVGAEYAILVDVAAVGIAGELVVVLTRRVNGEAPLLCLARSLYGLEGGCTATATGVGVGKVAVTVHDIVYVACVGDRSLDGFAIDGHEVEDEVVRLQGGAGTLLHAATVDCPEIIACTAGILDAILAVGQTHDIIGVPCGFVWIGGVAYSEHAVLVEVTVILGVDNLVASCLGVERDVPLLTLGLHVIACSGELGHRAGYVLGLVGEVLPVVHDEVGAVLDLLSGEHVGAVVVACLIGADERGQRALEEGNDVVAGYCGASHTDGALEVARAHSLLLLVVVHVAQIALDESLGLACRKGIVHRCQFQAFEGHIVHHIAPGSNLRSQCGIVIALLERGSGIGHEGEVGAYGLYGLGGLALTHELVVHLLRLHERGRLIGAAQAVHVVAEVYVVLAEKAELRCMLGHEILEGALP